MTRKRWGHVVLHTLVITAIFWIIEHLTDKKAEYERGERLRREAIERAPLGTPEGPEPLRSNK